ncbi:MAG: sulfatase-like hydrolase/transferase [Candidatus Helarchaeota archaeon]|nr:sulfatase-like hydrolase/transferase [Candidatus Helarchaeota archaeon]
MDKPNIIFILSDQQRHDTMGCYGQKLEVTPNLDNLAKKGVIFTHAFTCQPVCGPARSCIQTGLYATETGCFRNGIPLPISDKNIANYFSNNGYEVGYIGKWHLASFVNVNIFKRSKKEQYINRGVPLELRGGYKDFWLASDLLEFTSHGYDGYLFNENMNKVEFKGYRVDCLTDFVLKYLETRDEKKPFLLFISYLEPHHQNDHNQVEGPIGSKEKFKNYQIPGDLEGTQGDWRENYPDYLGCCNSIDRNFKRIHNKLEEMGILKNTLIIYTSDHGCHFRTRNGEYKRSAHEASIHIPLIIKGPGFQGGKKISELVSLIDLPPTLLTAGGIDVPKHMKGRPLHSLINSTPKDWSQEVFIQISESQVGRAIRTKRWKYSVKAPSRRGFYDSGAKEYEEELLYDLENDIYEKNNLIKDPNYSEIRIKLAKILKKKMVEAGEEVPIIRSI